jgi:hypothetical protein
MTLTSLNRWKAAAIHLGLSVLIALTVVTVMLLVWYPPPYFSAMGGQGLLKLLVGVDVTLGPLLTLIIFHPKKKSLRLDLSIIAAVQLAALAYGVYVMFEARPVYAAFAMDRFDIVSANELEQADLDAGAPEYRDLPLTGPRVVGIRYPDKQKNPEEWNKLVFTAASGKDVPQFPKYYVSYADIAADVLKKAKPLAALVKDKPDAKAAVQSFVTGSGRAQSDFVYVPLMGRGGAMTAVLDARDAKIVGYLSIDPY